MPSFLVGAGDLNPGTHACTAGTLPTKPSPQLKNGLKMHMKIESHASSVSVTSVSFPSLYKGIIWNIAILC